MRLAFSESVQEGPVLPPFWDGNATVLSRSELADEFSLATGATPERSNISRRKMVARLLENTDFELLRGRIL